MHKIFINGTPLILAPADHLPADFKPDDRHLIGRYNGKTKYLFHYIDYLEKAHELDKITLMADDLDQLWEDFKSLFKIVEAAGGLVFNQKNEALLIFRQGYWDLPKGKIEKGEARDVAAIREVQEETGLDQLDLVDYLTTSFHTYRSRKNKRILKPTYWYLMQTQEKDLIPQAEEGIELAVWRDVAAFLQEDPKIHGNLLEILRKAL